MQLLHWRVVGIDWRGLSRALPWRALGTIFGVLAGGLAFAYFLLWFGETSPPPAKAPVHFTEYARPGDVTSLRSGSPVLGFMDRWAIDGSIEATLAADAGVFEKLARTKGIWLPPGAHVTVLGRATVVYVRVARVRIEDGELKGQSFWVHDDVVAPLRE